MIFIAVGTQKFQLNRLLKKIDELVECSTIQEEVYAQVGNSEYLPQNYEYSKFLNKEEFSTKIKQCNVLITHGGVATIVQGLLEKKKVIVFPRLAQYGEHVDNHQCQIAENFSKLNYTLCCMDEEMLSSVIKNSYSHQFDMYQSQNSNMIQLINEYLKTL